MRNKPPTANERLDRIEAMLANERLDRIERALERATEENAEFRRIVRGAFTTQQEQIADLKATVQTVVQEWQAYLRRIPPS